MAGFAALLHRAQLAAFGAAGVSASFFQFGSGPLDHDSASGKLSVQRFQRSCILELAGKDLKRHRRAFCGNSRLEG